MDGPRSRNQVADVDEVCAAGLSRWQLVALRHVVDGVDAGGAGGVRGEDKQPAHALGVRLASSGCWQCWHGLAGLTS